MIAYYLPGVPFNEAPGFVATSRLCTMPGWRCLNDQNGGSIVYIAGWDKATSKIISTTAEGWQYAHGLELPKVATLLRAHRPESESLTMADGTEVLLPLVKRSARRFFFTPGGGGYGAHISEWALMALRLWDECQDPNGDGEMLPRISRANMNDVLATFYACVSQCYHLTHELASDLLQMTDLDLCKSLYTIWGYRPKPSGGAGSTSPSSPPESATASPSPPANTTA